MTSPQLIAHWRIYLLNIYRLPKKQQSNKNNYTQRLQRRGVLAKTRPLQMFAAVFPTIYPSFLVASTLPSSPSPSVSAVDGADFTPGYKSRHVWSRLATQRIGQTSRVGFRISMCCSCQPTSLCSQTDRRVSCSLSLELLADITKERQREASIQVNSAEARS